MKLITNEHKYILEKNEGMYIYPYLTKFECKNNLKIFDNKIQNENLIKLKILFENILSDLVDMCYQKPVIKAKHSTKFERFIFNGTKYVVNIVHSPTDRLIFLLYLKIEIIKQIINNKGWIMFNYD